MVNKKVATAVVGLTSAALMGISGPAVADDDRKVRHGKTNYGASYKMVLSEVDRDDRDRLRTTFFINTKKSKGKKWTVRVYRNGKQVHKATKRTNRKGNVFFADTFRGDDDARVKIVARAGYGDRAKRTMRLDD